MSASQDGPPPQADPAAKQPAPTQVSSPFPHIISALTLRTYMRHHQDGFKVPELKRLKIQVGKDAQPTEVKLGEAAESTDLFLAATALKLKS